MSMPLPPADHLQDVTNTYLYITLRLGHSTERHREVVVKQENHNSRRSCDKSRITGGMGSIGSGNDLNKLTDPV